MFNFSPWYFLSDNFFNSSRHLYCFFFLQHPFCFEKKFISIIVKFQLLTLIFFLSLLCLMSRTRQCLPPAPVVGGVEGLLLPLAPQLLGRPDLAPGRHLLGPLPKVPHSWHQTGRLAPDKEGREIMPVLAEHLTSPGVSDGPPLLPREVHHAGLSDPLDHLVKFCAGLAKGVDHNLEQVPQGLQPGLSMG